MLTLFVFSMPSFPFHFQSRSPPLLTTYLPLPTSIRLPTLIAVTEDLLHAGLI